MKSWLLGLWMTLIAGSLAPAADSHHGSTDSLLKQAEERLRAIYDRREFRALPFRDDWLPDGSGYTRLENTSGQPELIHYDAETGQRTVWISASQLWPENEPRRLRIDAYTLSQDGQAILLQTAARRADGSRPVIDYWRMDRTSGILKKVIDGADADGIHNRLSPDSRWLLHFRQGRLHVCDLQSLQSSLLVDTELRARAFRWSADCRRVALLHVDDSQVPLRPHLLPTDPTYPEVEWLRYPRVGQPLAKLRVAVIDLDVSFEPEVASTVDGVQARLQWIDLGDAWETFTITHLDWAYNSEELVVERLKRGRDEREVLLVDVEAGTVGRIQHEKDPAWVANSDRNTGLHWLDEGREWVQLSERDGWRHAYVISRDGAQQRQITHGEDEIIRREFVDAEGGWLYYAASPGNATQRYLYRTRLDGTGTPERLTPETQPGSHHYEFAPGGRWAFHTWSAFDIPPITELIELPEHRVVRILERNEALRERIAPLVPRPTEFFQLELAEDVVVDAWMIKPRDFDETKRYPVFVFVYGEPAGQTVLDDWKGGQGHTLFHRVIADLGYLVVSIDNRGTPAPKGAAWRRAVFGSLGPLSTEEQATALQVLGQQRDYVDLSRVGIWGWSGGGSNTLNAMFRKPDVYQVGIAVAPKPQPHLYHAGFQEIYMRTPESNPDGYRMSAPINFAEGLKGDLLILHGTGETNTHIQVTEGLVDRLIELGKQFDYMAYPNRDHGLHEGRGTDLHVRMLITRYLLEHLPPGPR